MDDPARAGLTNTGRPSSATRFSASARSAAHIVSVTSSHGQVGIPACAMSDFVKCLSMLAADENTPEPTKAVLLSSNSPCRVPSSPKRPCISGKNTSTEPSSVKLPSASRCSRGAPSAETGGITSVPLSVTSGIASGSKRMLAQSSTTRHTPVFVMPIGRTSKASESMAPITPAAVTQLTECSLERPPKRTATRGR